MPSLLHFLVYHFASKFVLLLAIFQVCHGAKSSKEMMSLLHRFTTISSTYRAYLAVGSNLGDRFRNIAMALDMLVDPSFDNKSYMPSRLLRTSFLHQTAPMYVTDQPAFLNGAVELETDLTPHALLRRVKSIEKELGRNFTEVRNGPRPIDLDLLLYDRVEEDDSTGDTRFQPMSIDTPTLTIPHRLMQEREFVLEPLSEIASLSYQHPVLKTNIQTLLGNCGQASGAIRVLPLPRGRMLEFKETIIMGILNVTPDSFSDGGKFNSSIDVAIRHAQEMESQGANIIDIGGESTRPGAKEISIEEQIQRTIPVILAIRKISDIPISIDTRHASVAQAAVEAGADIVNDVSGGTFDASMLPTVGALGVPIILMHMRGTPESMQSMTEYEDVVESVTEALQQRTHAAENAGIPRWLQVVDPGIGFAKDLDGNLSLLKHTAEIRQRLGNLPLLLGTSRKGFIGKLTGEAKAEDRDYGTVGSCIAALCLGSGPVGCNILRVHNAKAAKDAAVIMDAIRNSK